MKPIYHNKKIEDYIIPFAFVATFIVCLILLLFVSKSSAMSYLIGAITNILCFKLTIKTVDNVISNKVVSVRKAYAVNNTVKMGIYLMVLLVAGFSQKYHFNREVHLEIIPVAIAFFQIKFVIYFKYFIFDKIFNVKNFDDSLKGPIFPLEDEKEGDKDDY